MKRPVRRQSPGVVRHKPQQKAVTAYTRLAILGIVLFAGISTVVFALVRLPAFAIETIDIVGRFDNQSFGETVNGYKGRNIFLFNTNKEELSLKSRFPEILTISLHKTWPRSVSVIVNQRVPLAVLTFDNTEATESAATESASRFPSPASGFYIDEHATPFVLLQQQDLLGYATTSATTRTHPTLPLLWYRNPDVSVGRPVYDPYVKATMEFLALYEPRDVAHVKQLSRDSILLYLVDGIKVIITTNRKVSDQVAALQTVLRSTTIERKKISIIDVRFDNPVVTKR